MNNLKKSVLFIVFCAALTGCAALFLLVTGADTSTVGQQADYSYRFLSPTVDPEHRTKPLSETYREETLDLTAFAGMPDTYRDLVSEYVEAIRSEIGAQPLTRKRFYHKDRPKGTPGPSYVYPDDANPIFDSQVAIPLSVFPRPEAVGRWCSSPAAQADGWRPKDVALNQAGSVYGRTLIFKPGQKSDEPQLLPASPIGVGIPSWVAYVPTFSFNLPFSLPLGKVVLAPLRQPSRGRVIDCPPCLRLGEKNGAVLQAELITVPAHLDNRRLRWASSGIGTKKHTYLAYALIDGNGALRCKKYEFQNLGAGPISPYVRPLRCEAHQPTINQHDLLLLPTLLAWPPNKSEKTVRFFAHEEWCFDDWFPAQEEACWVIRETAESKPLQESFVLMPASEESDRPVFFIAIFAETEPTRLVRELCALHRIPAANVLNSTKSMERITELYENIKSFSFD